MSYTPRLKTQYKEEIVNSLKEKFAYTSVMQVPKIQKICLNQGVGDAVSDKRLVEAAVEEMTIISGQKANVTYSKKDISNFKLRKGMPIGAKVTLRGDQMYEFLDRLVAVALPRTRDFRGIDEKDLMEEEIILWELKNKLFFLKLILIKLNQSLEWI